MTELELEAWTKVRTKVITRDGHTCQSCRKQFKSTSLNVHHIISRVNGGNNELTNLITVCYGCHDIIEPLNLTKSQIFGFMRYRDEYEIMMSVKRVEISNNYDWRTWVYGGGVNPINSSNDDDINKYMKAVNNAI